MEFSILFIATLIITVLSNILTPCLSLSDTSSTQHRLTKHVLTSSHDQQPAVLRDKKHVFTKLPRKLLSTDETMNVSNDAGKKPTTEISQNTKKIQGTFSAKRPRNHALMEGRKGTRQTWVESKAYQYFTMDYTEVHRRLPVHNKFMPLNTEKVVVPNPIT